MRTIGEFNLVPVWVHPTHLVSSAILLMQGHKVKMLPVVASENLVGVVTLDRLLSSPGENELGAYMDAIPLVLSRSTPVRQAAEHFVKADADRAVVFESGRVYGVVTSTMLLAELGRSWDPLTNLSWSDTLREWGIDRLSSGVEITILFIDLDDFGQYNRQHGHVVGDEILRRISQALKECIDPDRDLLVRYAGDEFAVGTVRSFESAVQLSKELEVAASQSFSDDPSLEVTFSIGMSGGKRTKERDSVHYAATLDALINIASKDALARKHRKQSPSLPGITEALEVPETAPASPAITILEPKPPRATLEPAIDRPRVMFVLADDASPHSPTTVGLKCGDGFPTGVHMRGSMALAHSVALATADALSQCAARRITVTEVTLSEPQSGSKLVTVSASLTDDNSQYAVAATRPIAGEIYESVAETVIDAYFQRGDGLNFFPSDNGNGAGKLIDMYSGEFRQAE